MKGQRVLVDTMVVIEAHRMGCWNALAHYFSLETVEQCVIECATGYRRRKGYVQIDQQQLISKIKVHGVTEALRAALLVADPGAAAIDSGEKDLLSYALTQPDALVLCSPDKATVNSTYRLKFCGNTLFDRLVALEELALEAGFRKQGYGENHTKRWLTTYKTKVQLGIL